MSVGLGLITRMLADNLSPSFLTENGLAIDSFHGKEKDIYALILQHNERYGRNPTVETIEVECDVRFPPFPEEPIGYWIDKVEKRRQTQLILSATARLNESAGAGELVDARQLVRELYLGLTMRQTTDRVHLLTDVTQRVLEAHDRRQTDPVMMGVPFGLPYLDQISDGAQGTDTVAVVGRPGCLAADSRVYFVQEGQRGRWQTIEDAYHKWTGVPRPGKNDRKLYFWDRFIPVKTMCWTGEGVLGLNTVSDIIQSGTKQLWRVTTEAGNMIRATAEHPFLTPEGVFKPLQALAIGEFVVCKSRGRAGTKIVTDKVIRIDRAGMAMTYDIVMEPPHCNYVADGFVVHNTGKTYFLFKMALAGWASGYVPLVVSMEMSVQQCARRIMALRSSVPADMIRLGRLSYWGREKLGVSVNELLEEGSPPFHLMQGSLSSTVEDLVLRVQELKPSALYVDGAYLLRTKTTSEGRWDRVSYTAEFLKMIATEFNIPVISSYQFNRRGPGSLGNIALSDAVGQLASIVIGISDEHRDDASGWSKRTFKIVELLKGREGEKGIMRCVYDMERMLIEQQAVLQGGNIQDFQSEGGDDEGRW